MLWAHLISIGSQNNLNKSNKKKSSSLNTSSFIAKLWSLLLVVNMFGLRSTKNHAAACEGISLTNKMRRGDASLPWAAPSSGGTNVRIWRKSELVLPAFLCSLLVNSFCSVAVVITNLYWHWNPASSAFHHGLRKTYIFRNPSVLYHKIGISETFSFIDWETSESFVSLLFRLPWLDYSAHIL